MCFSIVGKRFWHKAQQRILTTGGRIEILKTVLKLADSGNKDGEVLTRFQNIFVSPPPSPAPKTTLKFLKNEKNLCVVRLWLRSSALGQGFQNCKNFCSTMQGSQVMRYVPKQRFSIVEIQCFSTIEKRYFGKQRILTTGGRIEILKTVLKSADSGNKDGEVLTRFQHIFLALPPLSCH